MSSPEDSVETPECLREAFLDLEKKLIKMLVSRKNMDDFFFLRDSYMKAGRELLEQMTHEALLDFIGERGDFALDKNLDDDTKSRIEKWREEMSDKADSDKFVRTQTGADICRMPGLPSNAWEQIEARLS